ncbi:MAG: phosphomannose isomerase type II C-terminal cupin domain [Pseudomonadota bacterium]
MTQQFKLGIPYKKATYEMNLKMNPHYNFNDQANTAVRDQVSAYDKAWTEADLETLADFERNALGGQDGYQTGVKVESPWGDNTVLEATIGEFGKNEDLVKKEITVNPGFMLSLQRHRGRGELWEVTHGALGVILDGEVHYITAGNSIEIPEGAVHCMFNAGDEPTTVIETQKGTCREADNVRIVDFNNRPTVPILTKPEAESAILYAEIHAEIQAKFGCEHDPQIKLSAPEYKQTVAELKHAA